MRRPTASTAQPTRSSRPARAAPAPLASSLASSSTSSLVSPPLPGLSRRGDAADGRTKSPTTDGNIQVVVRCRGTSPAEDARGVHVVAAVKATRGTEVVLTDPNPTLPSSSSNLAFGSSSSALPQAQTKTWDFGEHAPDGAGEPRGTVYGPDADQGMLYNDVAKPILQQVLQGYNCTIFAYGQTGTGKTYTMEGNLSPYHGTFHPDAGVVPRTLYSLFDRLAESKCEYSVRCSFIELYNEELRDLNAADAGDLSSSSSSTAPSPEPGARAAAPRSLRIYEETKNGSTGVTIQGLEETFIQNAEEGLRVLRRGSERRQIAATNCNERSSRSHSIFTIVVHVKDASKEGQDVLKVGKLNLVDLAGSENVGRSGAVQGRAREAGMINASLLALGRVINQLVDKSEGSKKQHIAYRESKLTRLLQDSLGGRTKTTIIATIAPTSYEETASTLTYAHQAKSIQNRPEVNQRVSRNVLLNQFATEIERLKADLQAARGHEGVYVSKETWDELEVGRLSFDETKRKLEITESQLQTTRDQFEQNFRLLSTREEQLRSTADELVLVKNERAATALALEETRLRLAQQEVLRDAFETSREGWKSSAGEALDDVEGLRAKLERKTQVEQANLSMIADARTAIAARTAQIDERTTQLRRAQEEFVARVANGLDEFADRQQLHLASTSDLIRTSLDAFATQLADLASSARSSDASAKTFQRLVDETCTGLFQRISAQHALVEAEECEKGEEMGQRLERHAEETAAALDALARPLEQLQADCAASLEGSRALLGSLREADAVALADENARLKRVVAALQSNLAAERATQEAEETALLRRLEADLSAARARRVASLERTYGGVVEEVEGLGRETEEARERRDEAYAELSARAEEVQGKMGAAAEGSAQAATQSRAALAASLDHIARDADGLRARSAGARDEQLAQLRKAAGVVRAGELDFRRSSSLTAQHTRHSLAELVQLVGDSHAAWQDRAGEVEQEAVSAAGQATQQVDAFSALSTACLAGIDAQSSSLADKLQQDLQSRLRHDHPTGLTPRARERPVDRLLPGIDLDAPDRPGVLERLLAVRSMEVAATTAALEDGAEGVHTIAAPSSLVGGGGGKRESLALCAGEGAQVAALVVPVPSARQSLAANSALSGKADHAGGRRKPAVLGERDGNVGVGARRGVRKVLAKGAK
ncbi:hypothetical protein JCM10207_008578 [Rhodosporidiobolus poonsookiae]